MNWQLSGLWVVVDVPDNNGTAPGGLTQALGASAGGPAAGGPQQRAPTRKRQRKAPCFGLLYSPWATGSPRGCTATYRPPVLRWAPPPLRNRGFKHLFVPPVRQFR